MEVDLDSSFESLECFNTSNLEENSLLNELYEELYSKSRLSFDQFDNTVGEGNEKNCSVDSDTSSASDDNALETATATADMQKSGIPTRSSPCKIPRREGSPSASEESGRSPSGIPVWKDSSGIPTRSPSASPTMIPRGIPRKSSTSSSGSSTKNSRRNSREDSPSSSGIPSRGSPRLSRDSEDEIVSGSPRRTSSGIPTRASSGIPKRGTPPGSPRTSGIPTRGSPVLSGIPRKSSRTEDPGNYDSDDSFSGRSPKDSRFHHREEHAPSEHDFDEPHQGADSPSNIPSGIPMRTSRFSSPIHTRNKPETGVGASVEDYRELASGIPPKVSSDATGTSTPKQLSTEACADEEPMEVQHDSKPLQELADEHAVEKRSETAGAESDGSQSGDSQMQSSVIIHSSCSEDEDPGSGSSLLYGRKSEKTQEEQDDYSLHSRVRPAPVDQQPVMKTSFEEQLENEGAQNTTPKKTSPLEGYVYRPYDDINQEESATAGNSEVQDVEFLVEDVTESSFTSKEYEKQEEEKKVDGGSFTSGFCKEVVVEVADEITAADAGDAAPFKPQAASLENTGAVISERMQTSTLSSMFDSTETYKSNGEEFEAMVRANMTESMSESLTTKSTEPDLEKIKEVVKNEDVDISYENNTIIMKVADIVGDNPEAFNLSSHVINLPTESDAKETKDSKESGNAEMDDQEVSGQETVTRTKDEEDESNELKHVYLKNEFPKSREIKEDIPEGSNLQTDRQEMYIDNPDEEDVVVWNGEVDHDLQTQEKEIKMADTSFEEVVERRKQIEIKSDRSSDRHDEHVSLFDIDNEPQHSITDTVVEPDYSLLSRVRPAPVESEEGRIAPTRINTHTSEPAPSVVNNVTSDDVIETRQGSDADDHDDQPKKKYGHNIMERKKMFQIGGVSHGDSSPELKRRESSEKKYDNVTERRKQIEIKSQPPTAKVEQMTKNLLNPWTRDVFEPRVTDNSTNETRAAERVTKLENDVDDNHIDKLKNSVDKSNDSEREASEGAEGEGGDGFHSMDPNQLRELESMYNEFESQVDDFLCFAEANLRGSTDGEDGGHHEVLRGKNLFYPSIL